MRNVIGGNCANRKLGGLKFRRQVPIGEPDRGFLLCRSQSGDRTGWIRSYSYFTEVSDLDRAIDLHEMGIRIVRFNNLEVDENLGAVLNAILYAADPEKSRWASGQIPGEPK